MITQILSKSADETYSIGEKIGNRLTGKEVIYLVGDLGAGKTLFTQGIATSLGINPHEVVSPTFTLVNEYMGNRNIRLMHIDLYRLGPSIPGRLPEIDDFIGEGIICIEWAQYLEQSYFDISPSITVTFHLSGDNDDHRSIHISAIPAIEIE